MKYNPWSDAELNEERQFDLQKKYSFYNTDYHMLIDAYIVERSGKVLFRNDYSILELGCGVAGFFGAIRKRMMLAAREKRKIYNKASNINYTGLEINRRAVRIAKKSFAGYKNFNVFRKDIGEVPWEFEQDSFDICIANSILSLTEKPYDVLLESLRVSKLVYFCEPRECFSTELECGKRTERKWHWMDEPFSVYNFAYKEFYEFAEKNDIIVKEINRGHGGRSVFLLEKGE